MISDWRAMPAGAMRGEHGLGHSIVGAAPARLSGRRNRAFAARAPLNLLTFIRVFTHAGSSAQVPSLMDTCVRNGAYDEALELHGFLGRLAALHADTPLVRLLAQQVREMRVSLISGVRCRLCFLC